MRPVSLLTYATAIALAVATLTAAGFAAVADPEAETAHAPPTTQSLAFATTHDTPTDDPAPAHSPHRRIHAEPLRAFDPTQPTALPVVLPAAAPNYDRTPATRTLPSPAIWDRLAACESSGRWDANTGNGFYGGLQFTHATWNWLKPAGYPDWPHQATRDQQITVATITLNVQGWGAWPACSRRLGLR